MAVSRAKLAIASSVMVLSVSSASILTRLASAPPPVVAFWRVAIASIIIASYYLIVDRGLWSELRAIAKSLAIPSAASGVLLALHFYAWIWSLKLTRVYVSTTLVCLHPLVTTALSALLLREYIKPLAAVGMVIATAGSSLVALSLADSMHWADTTGAVFALIAAFLASSYVVLCRYVRVRALRLGAYVLPAYTSAAIALLAISLAEGVSVACVPLRDVPWLMLLAVGPTIGGHTLLNYMLRYVRASVASVPIVLEPAGASILAHILLSEPVPIAGYVGVGLAVAGLIIATLCGPSVNFPERSGSCATCTRGPYTS